MKYSCQSVVIQYHSIVIRGNWNSKVAKGIKRELSFRPQGEILGFIKAYQCKISQSSAKWKQLDFFEMTVFVEKNWRLKGLYSSFVNRKSSVPNAAKAEDVIEAIPFNINVFNYPEIASFRLVLKHSTEFPMTDETVFRSKCLNSSLPKVR